MAMLTVEQAREHARINKVRIYNETFSSGMIRFWVAGSRGRILVSRSVDARGRCWNLSPESWTDLRSPDDVHFFSGVHTRAKAIYYATNYVK
jgi:hypothetical protein